MRSRILPVAGVSAAALVAAASFVPASAQGTHVSSATSHGASSTTSYVGASCYSQGDALDGNGISSQNFEAAFDAYDDMAADDFKVGKKGCTVKTVVAAGTYSAAGPAVSANVTFYKDKNGKPGSVIKSKVGKIKNDNAGTLTLSLGKKGVKLAKGTTWVSVQVNMDFGTSGQWYWSTATDGGGNPGQWQNPGGGFGTCPTWDDVLTCVTGSTSNEFSFSLS